MPQEKSHVYLRKCAFVFIIDNIIVNTGTAGSEQADREV
ncbi:hypothetical protein BFJ69_g14208 [Fusarium oxysporum]|uniref:Uncharacterized protein n=1 Tax=Fusarium oxysporum TaxID=5507 RepID=A0A420MI93_FUSOX|nr:hypothetical protein BFJ69_g14208 [Fusarium oxysporum]